MFWNQYRSADGSTYVSSATGLTPGEQARAEGNPAFVRQFQGDKYGDEYAQRTARTAR